MTNPDLAESAVASVIDALMKKAREGDRETVYSVMRYACARVELAARVNEVERVLSATLDAKQDVWSTTDDGEVIPLIERLDDLHWS